MAKRMKEALALVEEAGERSAEEAIKAVKETSKVKFDASVEVHVNLAIDAGKSGQKVRTQTSLPAGTGKTLRVAAFVTPPREKEAKAAGADMVGGEELIKQIKQTQKTDFDVAVAEPGIMKHLAQIAKILGQRKLMPSPKTGTVGEDVKKLIAEVKAGKIDIKTDDGGNIHQIIGKVSFDEKKLLENYEQFIDAVRKAKPDGVKSDFIRNIYLSSSMGPSVRVKN